jgi:hypothetical protein
MMEIQVRGLMSAERWIQAACSYDATGPQSTRRLLRILYAQLSNAASARALERYLTELTHWRPRTWIHDRAGAHPECVRIEHRLRSVEE